MKLTKEHPDDPAVQARFDAMRRAERFFLFMAGAGFLALLLIAVRVVQAYGP